MSTHADPLNETEMKYDIMISLTYTALYIVSECTW